MSEKVFITCAVTGSSPLPDHPNFPITPRQIADEGLAAAEAGASILHIHVRNPETGGTGLGLAIARDIARIHGGDILLQDSPHGGLRARIRLPI